MPPKKTSKPEGPSKKNLEKKKEKIIEDKTFGLKNKKGAKTQKFIQTVAKQVKEGGPKKPTDVLPNAAAKREEKKKELEELNQIFRPVVAAQKVEKGVDPKSVLCAFFKQGSCGKGDKCKFSHDVSLERKSEKKSAYVDVREEDNMENWDEEKLLEVVNKKHGEKEGKKMPTEIICRYFIDALESNKYGWFWECPNGNEKCHYRHALPPGFTLNKDKKKMDKKDDITIEELVEIERAKLAHDLPKIIYETFLAWKKKKIKERLAKDKKESSRKLAEFKAGRQIGLSGRDMFTFNPDLAIDEDMEDGEALFDHIKRENDEDNDEQYKEITDDMYARCSDSEDDDEHDEHVNSNQNQADAAIGGTEDVDDDTCDVPIDEDLFADGDLDDLEDEMSTMRVN